MQGRDSLAIPRALDCTVGHRVEDRRRALSHDRIHRLDSRLTGGGGWFILKHMQSVNMAPMDRPNGSRWISPALPSLIFAVFAVQVEGATLVEDSLHTASDVDSALATVEGTETFTGAGFQTMSRDDRIVYDLGTFVYCGYAEFKVTNFCPWEQLRPVDAWDLGMYGSHIFGLFEADHISFKATEGTDENVVVVQATYEEERPAEGRNERLKFKNDPCRVEGCSLGDLYLPPGISGDGIDWDLATTYTVRITWEVVDWGAATIRFRVSGGGETFSGSSNWQWRPGHPDAYPRIRFVAIGRDRQPMGAEQGGWFLGPVYSDLVIVDNECPAPTPPAVEETEEPAPDIVEESEAVTERAEDLNLEEPLSETSSTDETRPDAPDAVADFIHDSADGGIDTGHHQEINGGCSCDLAR